MQNIKLALPVLKNNSLEIKNKINSLSDLNQETLALSGSSHRRQMLDEVLQKNNIELIPKHLMSDSKLMADIIKKQFYRLFY